MQASPSHWEAFYAGVQKKTGLDLRLYKQDQLQRRILSMCEQKDCASLDHFGHIVLGHDSELRWFLDKLAINVSELFRNPEKWRELEEKILPELKATSGRLKCWSAGCSFGAEAHTLACLLDAKFPGSHTIVGTDIDETALDQAKRGEFCEADMRGVPANYKQTYFERTDTLWKAKPNLKKYLTFRQGNLLADRFDSGFDLILCRNVVIYFTDPAKDELYRRFLQALRPGGILFVGSTERIFNAREIGFESPLPFFYKKPQEGEVSRWRNAS